MGCGRSDLRLENRRWRGRRSLGDFRGAVRYFRSEAEFDFENAIFQKSESRFQISSLCECHGKALCRRQLRCESAGGLNMLVYTNLSCKYGVHFFHRLYHKLVTFTGKTATGGRGFSSAGGSADQVTIHYCFQVLFPGV